MINPYYDQDFLTKNNLILINKKRYYLLPLNEKSYIGEHTVPYKLTIGSKSFVTSSWVNLEIELFNYLYSLNPLSEETLLNATYEWSDVKPFSKVERTNFRLVDAGLYLNLNHSGARNVFAIVCILKLFNVDIEDTTLLIRKHYCVESDEVRERIASYNKALFIEYLTRKKYNPEFIKTVVSNIEKANRRLVQLNSSFNDFFLFDDYQCFLTNKKQVLDFITSLDPLDERKINAYTKPLTLLEYFYKYYDFMYLFLNHEVDYDVVKIIKGYLKGLLNNNISSSTSGNAFLLYLSLVDNDILKSLPFITNGDDMFNYLVITCRKDFKFEDPFISTIDITSSLKDNIESFISTRVTYSRKVIKQYLLEVGVSSSKVSEVFLTSGKNFLQDSYETKTNIDNLYIHDDVISEVKAYIDSTLTISDELVITKDSEINLVCSLSIPWNPYLFVSFVKKFLSLDFHIIDNSKKTNFDVIIKKVD